MPSITSNLTTFTNVENSTMVPTGSGQGAWLWSNPSNAQTDNNSYATFGYNGSNPLPVTAEGDSDTLDCRQLVTQVPTGATINGIEVVLKVYNFYYDTFYVEDAYVHLLKNSATIVNPTPNTVYEWLNVETTRTYGGPTDLWGTTWTASDINGSGFGVSLACRISLRTGGEPPFTPSENRVDQVYVNVYYTGGASGSGQTVYPITISSLRNPMSVTVKSSTNIAVNSIWTAPIPRPTIRPVITARPAGLPINQPRNLHSVKSVTGIRVNGVKTFDFTRPTVTSAVGIRLSGIQPYFPINTTSLKSVTAILPSSLRTDSPRNNTSFLASTVINPRNFTINYNSTSQFLTSTNILPGSLSSNFSSTQRILTSTILYPVNIRQIRSESTTNLLSNLQISPSGISNITRVSSFRLTNRFYDMFKTDGTLNFGDTADISYNATDLNYNRSTTAGTKVIAYQCVFDRGDDFYVQGLVKTDNGYTTSGLSGIGFGIQPTNKNYGYFAVVDVRNGTGGNTTHSLQLRKVDATGTIILASYNATGLITANTWYRIYAYWSAGNGISVYFNEKEGTPIGSVLTSTDSTFTSGYDGFTTFSNSSFDNLTNIPRQYVDITDGGIKPFYGLGLPSLSQGAASIRPSSITINNIGQVRIGSSNVIFPRIVPDITRFGTPTIARGVALILPPSIRLPNLGNVTILGGFNIQPVSLGIYRFGSLTLASGNVTILPKSVDYYRTFNVTVRANINVTPSSITLSRIFGQVQLAASTNIIPSGIRALGIGSATLQTGFSTIRPSGLDLNRIGRITINANTNINPRNFTNIIPPIGIILKVNTNIIPSNFTQFQIGRSSLLTSTTIRPTSFTRIVSPSGSITSLINILPGTINAGALGTVTFRGNTNIRPSGLRITQITGVSSLSISSAILPSGVAIRNLGTNTIRSSVSILPSGLLTYSFRSTILINRQEKIIPNGFNNSRIGIVTLAINTNIRPSGLTIPRIGDARVIAGLTSIRPSGVFNSEFGNIILLGDNNIKPAGINIARFGQIQILAGPRVIIPSSIRLVSVVRANLLVNANIIPYSIRTDISPRNITLTGATLIIPSGIRLFDRINLSLTGRTAILPSGLPSYNLSGTIRLTGNTNIVPRNFTNLAPLTGTRILSSTLILPPGMLNITRVPTGLRLTGGTVILPSGLPMPVIGNLHRLLSSAIIRPSSISIRNTPNSITIRSNISLLANSIGNYNAIGNIRLTNRFYDMFGTDGTINFGDLADLTYNSTDKYYSRSTTAGTKVVAYQCIFDRGNDFYVQGLVKTDDGYTTSGLAGIGFGIQPSNKNYGYFAVIDVRNGTGGNTTHSFQLRRVDASGTTILASHNTTGLIKANTWYRIYAYWTTSGITVYLNEKEGTQIGAVLTSADSTFTSGYDGFTSFSNASFDNLTNIPRQYVDITDGGINIRYNLGRPAITQGSSAIQPSSITISNIGNVTIVGRNVITPSSIGNLTRIGTITIRAGVATILPNSVFLPRNLGFVSIVGGGAIQPAGLPIQRFGTVTILAGGVTIRPSGANVARIGAVRLVVNANIIPGSINLNRNDIGNVTIRSSTIIYPRTISKLDIGTVTLVRGGTFIQPAGLPLQRVNRHTILSSVIIYPGNFTNIVPPTGIIIKALTTIRPVTVRINNTSGIVRILSSAVIQPRNFTNIQGPRNISLAALTVIRPGSVSLSNIFGTITLTTGSTAIRPSSININTGLTGIRILSSTIIYPSTIRGFELPSTITIRALTVIRPESVRSITAIGQVTILSSTIIYPRIVPKRLEIGAIRLLGGTRVIQPGSIDITQPSINIIINSVTAIRPGSIRGFAGSTGISLVTYKNIIPGSINLPPNTIGTVTIRANVTIRPGSIVVNDPTFGSVRINSSIIIYPGTIRQRYDIGSINLRKTAAIIPGPILLPEPTSNIILASKVIIYPDSIRAFISMRMFPYFDYNPNAGIPNFIYMYGLDEPTTPYFSNIGNIRIAAETKILPQSIQNPVRYQIGSVSIKSVTAILPNSVNNYEVTNLHTIRAGSVLIRPSSISIKPEIGLVTILASTVIRPGSITLGNTNAIGQVRFVTSTNILPPSITPYELPVLHLIKPGPIIIRPYSIIYSDIVPRVTIKALNTIIVREMPDIHRIGEIVVKSVTAIIPRAFSYFRIGRHKILMSTTPGNILSYYELVETIEDDIEVVEMEQILEEFDSSIESDIQ